jgi:hypothetical protein
MNKEKNQLDLLWQYTAPIDTWIIDHITFSKNGWGQKVQIGSCLHHIHEDPSDCDIIRYDRSPGNIRNDEDADALFIIYFYSDRAEFTLYDRRQEEEQRLRLTYEDPTMFDRLESAIWNCRTIDYIYADLKAMEENLRLIRDGLWDDPQKMVCKSIGHLGGIFDQVSGLDAHVRKIARIFVREEDVAHSINSFKMKDPPPLIEDDPDEIPF